MVDRNIIKSSRFGLIKTDTASVSCRVIAHDRMTDRKQATVRIVVANADAAALYGFVSDNSRTINLYSRRGWIHKDRSALPSGSVIRKDGLTYNRPVNCFGVTNDNLASAICVDSTAVTSGVTCDPPLRKIESAAGINIDSTGLDTAQVAGDDSIFAVYSYLATVLSNTDSASSCAGLVAPQVAGCNT